MSNEVERLLALAGELQTLVDTDPKTFGDGYTTEALQEVIEAWEAVSASADMFLSVARAARGISSQ